MSNVMSLKKLRNKVTRNGFDLSQKNVFSAKVGELLPICCKEVIPGDSFRINTQHFTRTMPVNTAAYTRIREYYDWFFVPYNLLWNRFPQFVTQMQNNGQVATSVIDSGVNNIKQPTLTVHAVSAYLKAQNLALNQFKYYRADLSCKLLSYLDYGSWRVDRSGGASEGNQILGPNKNIKLNPFPLLAYQKIYSDYYRNSQWEKSNPASFNVDYLAAGGDIPVDKLFANSTQKQVYNMFDLRYCNWNKDYFMGVLPSSQYGSVASVNSANPFQVNLGIASVRNNNLTSGYSQAVPNKDNLNNLVKTLGFNTSDDSSYLQIFSILQLRQVEAKQKWAEITQSQSQDYKSQVEAHFNASPDNSLSQRCLYLGGDSGNIDITEVVNTNLDSQSSVADIAGKGVGAGQGYIDFKSDVHGVLMCIYHAVPLLDYANSGINRFNLKTDVFDYAIPEFDKAGMVQIPIDELSTGYTVSTTKLQFLGYAPRYYDYKTSYDKVHGAFVDGGLDSWVAPLNDKYIVNYLNLIGLFDSTSVNQLFFQVNPSVVNPIFAHDADSFNSSDQLLVNCNFDIKAVRCLDYNGLPY